MRFTRCVCVRAMGLTLKGLIIYSTTVIKKGECVLKNINLDMSVKITKLHSRGELSAFFHHFLLTCNFNYTHFYCLVNNHQNLLKFLSFVKKRKKNFFENIENFTTADTSDKFLHIKILIKKLSSVMLQISILTDFISMVNLILMIPVVI